MNSLSTNVQKAESENWKYFASFLDFLSNICYNRTITSIEEYGRMPAILEHVFPDCFPPNFEDEILPGDIEPLKFRVYRICTRGILNREAFLSTYEEVVSGLKPEPMRWNKKLSDPSTYSTSCDYDKDGILHVLACLRDHYPAPIVVCGEASYEYGPVQKTEVRSQRPTTHVDWWIYKDADPSENFDIVEE